MTNAVNLATILCIFFVAGVGDTASAAHPLPVVDNDTPAADKDLPMVRKDLHEAEKETGAAELHDVMLNIGFAHDPGTGHYDGAVGSPRDIWNLVSMGTTAKDYLRNSDTTGSPVRLRVSRHDGAWGITGHHGIFRGYIYDNCQCKDLAVTLLDMPSGHYRIYVYAHGDAPNQNANIELKVGGKTVGIKPTANDDTYGYRSSELIKGVQFVTFDFQITQGEKARVISRRAGSRYSMFNAIQIVPLVRSARDGVSDDRKPLTKGKPILGHFSESASPNFNDNGLVPSAVVSGCSSFQYLSPVEFPL